ncbi:hypothetical protein QE381_002590 [Microbacterium sp. SORGH_AS 888]|nr:hypothetical protein [Microbacterium sp. SORGH_AS_0888]
MRPEKDTHPSQDGAPTTSPLARVTPTILIILMMTLAASPITDAIVTGPSSSAIVFATLFATLFVTTFTFPYVALGILAVGGALYVAIAPVSSRRRGIGVLIFGVLALWIVFTFAPPDSLSTLMQRLTTTQGEDNFRGSMQSAGWAIAGEYPFGVGLGQFSVVILQHGSFGALADLAHHRYLLTALVAEVRIFGTVGVFLMLAFILGAGVRRSLRQGYPPTLGVSMAIAGFAIQGFVDYLFYETASLVAFALILGLVAPSINGQTRPRSTVNLSLASSKRGTF